GSLGWPAALTYERRVADTSTTAPALRPPTAPTPVVFSPKVKEIIATIHPEELRRRVEGVVQRSLEAIGAIRRVHLPQDEFELGSEAQDPEHLDLAPYVLGAVAAVNRLLAFMVAEFPAPPLDENESNDDADFDLEFDLVDGPGGEGGLS